MHWQGILIVCVPCVRALYALCGRAVLNSGVMRQAKVNDGPDVKGGGHSNLRIHSRWEKGLLKGLR